MRLIPTWTHSVIVSITLVSGSTGLALADGTLSSSNRAGNDLGGQMQALLGQERAAVGAIGAGRLQQLTALPVRKAAPAADEAVAAQAVATQAVATQAVAAQVVVAQVVGAQAVVAQVVVAQAVAQRAVAGGQGSAVAAKVQPALVAATVPEQPTRPAATDAARAVVVLATVRPALVSDAAAKPASFWELLTHPQQPGARAADPVAPDVPGVDYSVGWLASQPAVKGDANWECLARALYFEARGESVKGQFAVGEVVLNRVDSGLYPRSICGVVNQGSRYACQFSFICDGHADRIHEPAIYQQVGKIAALLIAGAPRTLTDGATHFRTGAVMPSWARRFTQTAKIGAHYFHRQPMRLASD